MTADVVIVGGGLVGATTAAVLGAQGRDVVLIERERPQRRIGELGIDIRNVALSSASRVLLEGAGVWRQLSPVPYTQMCVSEERGTRRLDFSAAGVDRDELGWICEHSEVVCALWQMLDTMDNVELHVGEELEGLSSGTDHLSLKLSSGQVTARLLIGADGNQSRVRDLLEVRVSENPTGHHALATVISTEESHKGVAWQRFLLGGPLAVLPSRHPHMASVVWSQSSDEVQRRTRQDADAFCDELTGCMEGCLGVVKSVDRRLSFPVSQMLAHSFNPAPRVLIIGDAAHSIHPLAGLGANVGFEDVRDLAAKAGELGAEQDLGAARLWVPFARKRRLRAKLMLALMTGLRQAYAAEGPLSGLVRNTGVGWIDDNDTIKGQFVREALGLGPLAQGLGPAVARQLGSLVRALGPLAQHLVPREQR